MSDNIKVVVKVRPLISREIEEKLSYQWRVKNDTLYQLDQNGREFGQYFTFDKVYDKDTQTSDVYNDIAKPIVEAATAGINGTIFAYGQTSSGKTYTMTGTDSSPGIIPLAVLNLFEIIKNAPDRDFLVRVSYIEIYNETVKDLLNPEKENIKIHETFQGIKVDVGEKVTSSPEEVLEAMKEGEANRQKGATNMNELSSRSHSIFQITIESREHVEGGEQVGSVNVSQLNLVDLAGSERAGQTGATGLRFKEGTHINKSLSSLALVIKQLSEDPNKYANYRDSKLTRILQNSLGGNAKTSIICAVTPAAVEETISTLQFANRAKAIKNKPEVNAVATDASMIQSLTKQMSKLQTQLESKKNLEQDNYKLQKQIALLQKLILNGFGQRRNESVGASRRQVQQPRRITISAFHSLDKDEEILPVVPKFCTPSLKYNPNLIPNPVDFVPIQSSNKLASVPEEPSDRLITPPPRERKVNFNDEVIEIDSDDDSTQGDSQTCSPYHTCQEASKTPPCVLRKNARSAEKNLKDILELTEREKMYKPSENELLLKIEKNVAVISSLKDEVETLRRQSLEKDLAMAELKNKIKRTEEDVKAITSEKIELKTKCDTYDIKLTDWEVSYETLKKKAKLREEELLSLLEEMKVRKVNDISKQLAHTIEENIPFMDSSKEIALINSDNESNSIKDEITDQICDLVTDTQTQSNLKNQAIIELETDLFNHKQKIVSLENITSELQDTISCFKEKVTNMENENSLLKSVIDNLNSTINNQKSNLETAHNDIESYNSVIQELQIKLTQKENMPNININDSVLENMIANEEKFLANNENMKNIIQCLKNVLDCRNKEISQLKSTLQTNDSCNNNNLELELEYKTKQMDKLKIEVDNLKKEINENIATINKLMRENCDLKILEQELTTKLSDVEVLKTGLENINKENVVSMKTLEQEIDKLNHVIMEKNKKELDMINIKENLSKEITTLQHDVYAKDEFISSLNQKDKESIKNIEIAETAIQKLKDILSLLTGEIQEVPEVIDNFVNIFNVFSDYLSTLQTLAADIVAQKDEAITKNISLKESLETIVDKHNIEIYALQNQLDEFNNSKNNEVIQNQLLTQQILQLKEELKKIHDQYDIQLSDNDKLKINLNQNIEYNQKLHQEIVSKENIIQSLNTKEKDFSVALESQRISFDRKLQDKEETITKLTLRLEALEHILEEKSSELDLNITKLTDVQMGRDKLLNDILKKVSDITNTFNIENNVSCQFEDSYVNIYERILLTLDKIANHITFINMKNVDCEQVNITEILSEAQKQIKLLSEQNLKLTSEMFNLGNKNSELSFELEKIQSDNKILNEHLVSSQEILQNVKKELKIKSKEILNMEDKVRDWKDQFTSMDVIMKQQMHELHIENEYLKGQRSDIKKYEMEFSDGTYNTLQSKRLSYVNNNAETISPPSLLTMCCEKIINCIQSNESDCNTTPSNSDTVIEVKNNSGQLTKCQCNVLSQELRSAREEKSRIMDALVELEIVNQNLVKEHEEARNEIMMLLDLEKELQKKIINHRTNLSILTATTFAENKSLKSQVKVLQHHHSRFHNVCQRDIPDFKKQLRELMSILNGNTCICDTQNTSFKRYSLPDVLDSSTAVPNFKNESTLDGDLLMLDTNITLTTAADNTLLGADQTCLDLTQSFYNEASCQTNEIIPVHDQKIQAQIEILSNDNRNMVEKLKLIKEENKKLQDQVEKRESMIDAQNSPLKNQTTNFDIENKCSECRKVKESHVVRETLEAELISLSKELLEIKSKKTEIELKYNNLVLETPSTEALVRKLSILEKEYSIKDQEINKLNESLNIKSKEIKRLQEENDSLSTQVFDNVSEADDLNKELDNLKQKNTELINKCSKLEQSTKTLNIACSECINKDEYIRTMQLNITKAKLNRSLSDSDTSSRYNKICTLQSELHAGRQDCKELTEDVVTIKNHLDRSNISMDLDESIEDSSVFTFPKDNRIASPQSNKCYMPDIPEERHLDMYMLDKRDCLKFYCEKTGTEKDNFGYGLKIMDIMNLLYDNLTTKHSDEVKQLSTKLSEYANAKVQLQVQIDNAHKEYSELSKEIEEKNKSLVTVLSQIRSNVESMKQEVTASNTDKKTELINKFKDHFLKFLDKELGLSSVSIFESIIENIVNTHQAHLTEVMDQYKCLQNHMENVTVQLNEAKENLSNMNCKLLDKETEYNLLKAQYENIQKINNAVTLDIIHSNEKLHDAMAKGYQRLIELDILAPNTLDLTLPVITSINTLFDQFITQSRVNPGVVKESEDLRIELTNLKITLADKEKELSMLKTTNDILQETNNTVTSDVIDKENKIQTLKNIHEELNQVYESKVDENKSNLKLIEKITEEINLLKNTIEDKINTIENLETELHSFKQNKEQVDAILELLETIKEENESLKNLNVTVVKEKDTYALELIKSADTIKQNNIELDRMTSDILVLRETVKDNTLIIDNMKKEAETLIKVNMELRENFEAKCRECSRLETNIKTHEKTAEIQTRIINRLEKQKNEDDSSAMEKNKQLEELSQRCATLQTDCDALQSAIKSCRDENDGLRRTKEYLEARIADLETAVERHKPRSSLDAIADSSRRRRQSMHDSKRQFAEDKNDNHEHNHGEAIFGARAKPEDIFMDVDEEFSDRSTPIRLSRGRDSLSASRAEPSDKEEEHSRPSSVVATRRRRQSTHDLQRTVLQHSSPLDLQAARLTDASSDGNDGEVSELKHRLTVCQQELEDLKEKYKELDDECETCAEYLRERDQQCVRLKKEKTDLQETIEELKQKLQSSNSTLSQGVESKPSMVDAAVNTDEDWTKLHSVVVDRMSYDAEVEKNKRLTKIIEELRFKKQDLKNTLSKMQKALERNSSNRELETTKKELDTCKKELKELRERYKELDEECETCAQYLREREEQCRKLSNIKMTLEAKLQEYQQEGSNITQSSRKKRQSLHDQNRPSAVEVADATTETTDFLTYQVERDDNLRVIDDTQVKEMKRLKMAVEKLSQQKAALEQQLAAKPSPALYVATGSAIIQNQQLTDVMKENQKLKKINAKLVNICKKRGKDSNRENEDPAEQC